MIERYGNKILYNMCEENREHKNINVVEGKIWLIGRSYSASPERRQGKPKKEKTINEKKEESDFLLKISEYIVNDSKTKELDNKIESMRNPIYTFTYDFKQDQEMLRETVELVQLLNEIIMKASNKYNLYKRRAENNISFASKYLHFHLRDIVYIFDSIACGNAREQASSSTCNNKEFLEFVSLSEETYKEYAKHVMRCHCIAIELKKNGNSYSPRAVDDILIGYNQRYSMLCGEQR